MAPFRINGLGELAPVIPAPMSGYTDRAMRDVARRMGCTYTVVPLVSAEGLARDDRGTRALLDIGGEPRPVCVQLFGARPEALAESARRAQELGASAVDLNLGCPARRVVRHEGGVGLMKNPEHVRAIVAAMRRAVTIPLTVKLRAGWDCTGFPTAVEIARILEGEGADAVTVHGRTARQMFTGQADWRWVAEVRQAVAIPVIGNGDICSGEHAWRMLRQTACQAVMIGRGAIGNPWVLRDALAWIEADGPPADPPPEPTVDERLAMMLDHLCLMAGYRGEARAAIEFRKHATRYIRGITYAKPLKQALVSATSVAQVEQAVAAFRVDLTLRVRMQHAERDDYYDDR